MTDSLPDPLLTIGQLAAWIGKSKKTLYRWREQGLGPASTTVGGDIRYRRSVVDCWLDDQTEKVA